jgi:hypothetical protein
MKILGIFLLLLVNTILALPSAIQEFEQEEKEVIRFAYFFKDLHIIS